MPKEIRTTFGEPHERLGRIGSAMLDALEEHAENEGDHVKAIVLLDDMEEGRGTTILHGYHDNDPPPTGPSLAIARLLEHALAIAKANDIPLSVASFPPAG